MCCVCNNNSCQDFFFSLKEKIDNKNQHGFVLLLLRFGHRSSTRSSRENIFTLYYNTESAREIIDNEWERMNAV